MTDVHTRNVVLKDTQSGVISERELIDRLGPPETREVTRDDGRPLEPGIPSYLVWPVSLKMATKSNQKPEVRVVDFGEAFTPPDKPETLRTPLALRAPEVLFEDKWDHRADLWSAACLVSVA